MRVYTLTQILARLGRLVERNTLGGLAARSLTCIFMVLSGEVGVANTSHTFSLGLMGTAASEFRLDWSHQVGPGILLGLVLLTQSSVIDGVSLTGPGIGLQMRRRISEAEWGTGWVIDGRFLFRRAVIGFQGRDGTFDFAELQGLVGYHRDFSWFVLRAGAGFRWRGLGSEYWLVGSPTPLKASLGAQSGFLPILELGLLKEF
ncbi:MAG: hypothetical protein K2X47_04365 [Bdellovibrionales bacterium]|nr:hypothetical protein [Bdellovibrionales bacterium]